MQYTMCGQRVDNIIIFTLQMGRKYKQKKVKPHLNESPKAEPSLSNSE